MKNIIFNDILTVKLFGQAYKFKFESTNIDPEAVLKVLLDEIGKIESEQQGKEVFSNKIVLLIMAALNIALENVELQQFRDKIMCDIYSRSENLIKFLDEHID